MHSPSPISASARCASGARSPLAPTLPCDGTIGVTPRFSISQIVSITTAAHAGVALGKGICPQQHHGASLGDGKRLAHSYRMRAHQVDLQFANLVSRDAHVAQFAYAGRDGVRHLFSATSASTTARARSTAARASGVEQDRARSTATSRTSSSVRSFPLM